MKLIKNTYKSMSMQVFIVGTTIVITVVITLTIVMIMAGKSDSDRHGDF